MRNIFKYICLALVLAAAPARLMAQEGRSQGAPKWGHHGKGPVEMLLRERAELNLTDAQVVRLKEIDARMVERNRPYVQQLTAMRRALPAELRGSPREMTEEQRAAFREKMKAAKPLFERIHENNHAAMREVGEVLNAEQKARVREMLRKKGDSRERGRDKPDQRQGDRSN